MNIRIIEDRIRSYDPISKRDELNAMKEITQEITLLALSRSEFFKHGCFQGGTCLRILYGLSRFSEDLDFILFKPMTNFLWQPFLNEIKLEFESFGLTVEVKDRSVANTTVKKAFLKENSFGKTIQLYYTRDKSDVQSILIKLEVDTNPPLGSDFETHFVDFPTPFSVVTQTLPSLFAGKLHALLCRDYVKGRDWYDFIWYVTRKTKINFQFLQNALIQQGPWQNQWKEKPIVIDMAWVCQELERKIASIDWKEATKDVENFIKLREAQSLQLWNVDFFNHFVQKLSNI